MDGDAGRRRGPAARSPTGRADRSCAPGASPPTTGFRGHTVTEPSPGEAEASLEKLTAPRDGLVPVIDRIQTLRAWCEAAASAPEEPVAVDAERASSYRYTSRSYLLQLRTGTAGTDRKSTRLNSSHVAISYAVFCLKKKKPNHNNTKDAY